MDQKNILTLICGLAIGAAAGVFGSKKYFEKKYSDFADKQIKEMEEYYGRADEYARGYIPGDEGEEINPQEEEKEEDKKTSREKGVMSPEERKEIKEKLNRNREEKTNYAAMYHEKGKISYEDDLAESEHPGDSDEDDEEDLENSQEAYWNDWKEENKDKHFEIITEDQIGDFPAFFEEEMLYYYMINDVLVNEDDEEIGDPGYFVGDLLDNYIDNLGLDTGEAYNGDDIIVANYDLDKIYTIEIMSAVYEGGE